MSNDSSFKVFTNESTCAAYVEQAPIYIQVRREVLLHLGIGDPLDPYKFAPIADNILVYTNDVNPPFQRIVSEEIYVGSIKANPYGGNTTINVPVILQGCRVISSGIFTALLSSANKEVVLNSYRSFLSLDQIIDFFAPGETLPLADEFDIDIDFENGTGPNNENYIGFTNLSYHPDNPSKNPNGLGYYFFTVKPLAKIKYKDQHN